MLFSGGCAGCCVVFRCEEMHACLAFPFSQTIVRKPFGGADQGG